jgi:RNA polymerase sigma factor (TIGR02999 family)
MSRTRAFISRAPIPQSTPYQKKRKQLLKRATRMSWFRRRLCARRSRVKLPVATDASTITRLLVAWREGDGDAANQLMPLVYGELRAMAHRQFGGRDDATLQPTAIVHEAYLKLKRHSRLAVQDRHHFFAVAAKVMRQLVVDYARKRVASKRGGQLRMVTLDDVDVPAATRAPEIVALDLVLDRLARLDESLSRLVELRFFAGLSVEETADVLGCSPRTVKRDWRKARALIYAELTADNA